MAADESFVAPADKAPLRLRSLWRALRFSPCACGPRDLVRLRRNKWLRWLLPRRRLYRCPHCGSIVFYGR
jgi:hypothetical protein